MALSKPVAKSNLTAAADVQTPKKVPSDLYTLSLKNASLAASEAPPLPLSTVKVTELVDAASVSAA